MFEAVFKIVARVESNGHGERLFTVYEQGALRMILSSHCLLRMCTNKRCIECFERGIP